MSDLIMMTVTTDSLVCPVDFYKSHRGSNKTQLGSNQHNGDESGKLCRQNIYGHLFRIIARHKIKAVYDIELCMCLRRLGGSAVGGLAVSHFISKR
jgi:hypothetical protein